MHQEQLQTYNQEHGKLKKIRILSQVHLKGFVQSTEKLSKKQISLQIFFKNFADRFRIAYLKNGFP